MKFIEVTIREIIGNLSKGDKIRVNIDEICAYHKYDFLIKKEIPKINVFPPTRNEIMSDDFFKFEWINNPKSSESKKYEFEEGAAIILKSYERTKEIKVYETYQELKKMIEGD